METVNIANNEWLTNIETSTIDVVADSTFVEFDMGNKITEEASCAKACIAIDASSFKTITLQYSSVLASGITSLYFGVFDHMTAEYYYNTEYDNGISSDSLSGVGVIQITPDSEKTITIDISSTSGVKFVGFLFYGNTHEFNDEIGWSAEQKINITSLTAVESGYTLTYDANGGSGAPGPVSNVTSTTISSAVLTRSGYDFLGWSTSSTATSANYVGGNSISLTSDVTLYAVWKRRGQVYIYDNTGEFSPYQVLIYDDSGWNQYVPYIYTESGWEMYSG